MGLNRAENAVIATAQILLIHNPEIKQKLLNYIKDYIKEIAEKVKLDNKEAEHATNQ